MADSDEHHSQAEMKKRMEAVLERNRKASAQPHMDFPGKADKGSHGPKPPAPKARNFRHQGR